MNYTSRDRTVRIDLRTTDILRLFMAYDDLVRVRHCDSIASGVVFGVCQNEPVIGRRSFGFKLHVSVAEIRFPQGV